MQAKCWAVSATYPFAQQILCKRKPSLSGGSGCFLCGVACLRNLQALIESRALLVSTDQLFQVGLTTWCFKTWLLQAGKHRKLQSQAGSHSLEVSAIFDLSMRWKEIGALKSLKQCQPGKRCVKIMRMCWPTRWSMHVASSQSSTSRQTFAGKRLGIHSINLGLTYFART